MAASVGPDTIRLIVSRWVATAAYLDVLAPRMPRNRAAVPSVRARDTRLRLPVEGKAQRPVQTPKGFFRETLAGTPNGRTVSLRGRTEGGQ